MRHFWGFPPLKRHMAAVFGVCVGSVSASIATCKSGKIEVLANDVGERSTPMLVAYSDKEKVIGRSAKQALHRSAGNTTAFMTVLLTHGLNDPKIQDILKQLPCQVVDHDGSTCYKITQDNKQALYVPVKAPLVDVFRKLYETAKSFDRDSDCRVVISVSSDFTAQHRQTLSGCASETGFTVMRVVSQASTCCLQYNIGQKDKDTSKLVLVYSLGHCSLELSLLSVAGGMFRTLASHTDYSSAGRNLDDAITKLLLSEFQRQWKCDVSGSSRAMHKLRAAVEVAKHTLSTNQTASVHVESLHEGIDFQYTLTRGRFEGICTAIFRSCIDPIKHFLQSANITKQQLDHVVLAGGSCKIPRIQQLLVEEMAPAEVLCSVSPDELAVLGSATQAGLMGRWEGGEGGDEGLVLCTPYDLWLVCADMESNSAVKLLPSHIPIPCTRTATIELPPPIPGQDSMCIEFREGVSNIVAKVTVPMTTQSCSKVEVEIHWKKDNTVSVATKLESGNWQNQFELECQ